MNDLTALRDRTREFIRSTVVPAEPSPGEALSSAERRRLQALAKEAEVFAPHVPQRFGGLGVPIQRWSPLFQEAGYSPIGPAVLNCMAPDEGNMYMLERVATDDQASRYLVPLADGAFRSCFAMTEPHPGAGSDPHALSVEARRVEGGWRISGEKRFISGAEDADFVIIMARTPELGEDSATMFLSPMSAPGIRLGHRVRTMEAAITGGHPHLHFEELFVADGDVLGKPGEGFQNAQVRLGPARLTHCMRWLGLARRAQDTALDRADTREIFGNRIAELGMAQAMLADSEIDIATSDAIIRETADALSSDERAGARLSSIAKVHCAEAAYRIVDRAVQLCGGDGVTLELPLLTFLNEIRPFRVYDGSSETHRMAIARRASSRRRREREAGADRLDVPEGASK